MIWGIFGHIESGPSELKKWGFQRCSVKNAEAQTTFSEVRRTRGKPSICAAKLGLEGFPTLHTQCPVWSGLLSAGTFCKQFVILFFKRWFTGRKRKVFHI